jgi:hypothetical protein
MASSDWLTLATTALGGLLAAGGGALVQWAGSRRADERAREELRRAAYVQLVAALGDLVREIVGWRDLESLMVAIRSVEHACAAVILAGPAKAAEVAYDIQVATFDVVRASRTPDATQAVADSFVPITEAFIEFRDAAQSILGTDRE